MNFIRFEDMASELDKIGPSFNSFPSLPSVAIDDRNSFNAVRWSLITKDPFWGDSIDTKTPFS